MKPYINHAAINEKIAAWFEPKPTHFPEASPCPSGNSIKRNWWWHWMEKTWKAADFFTEEAANARLLDAMPRGALNHRDDRDCAGGVWEWECNANGFLSGPIIRDPDRKTAIVLTFCSLTGIDTSPGLINPASAEESRSIHASFLPEEKMFEPSG